MFSKSQIMELSAEKRSQLLGNETLRMLVQLYHSHNIYHPANRTRKELIAKYMTEANLKKNILKTFNHIIDHEMKPENASGIPKSLEYLRKRIYNVYLEHSKKSTKFNTSPSCVSFSENCSVSVNKIKKAINSDDRSKNLFEKLGGFYVLLDVFQTHYILHNKDCTDDKCIKLMTFVFEPLHSICSHSKDSFCRLTDSPFHLTMFIDLIVNNCTNYYIVHWVAWILGGAFFRASASVSNTLQNCQAIRRLTEIMMKTNDDGILSAMCFLMGMIVAKHGPPREEFIRIDGAVAFVVSKFVEYYSWAIDGRDEEYKHLSHVSGRVIFFVNQLSPHVLSSNLAIRDLYWDANVSIILVGLIKVACKVIPNSDFFAEFKKGYPEEPSPDRSMFRAFDNSIGRLLEMLYISPRERIKVRELVGVEFFRELLTFEWIRQIHGGDLNVTIIRDILGLLEQE